jgi:hypothetical protein
MWITWPAEASLLLHFTTFVLPMQEVAKHTDYKALYDESQLVITQLRHELDQLKKMIFGSRQERFILGQLTDPTQLSMGLLERKEILVDVAGKEGCREIGRDITEELEYEPGKLYVNRYIRPKYASADNQTILMAPLPERPLPKAIAGPGQLYAIERSRKNYLFAGSHEAAQRSAMLYSLMGTCKLHDINPFTWLKNVLEKIPSHPINKIQQLLPYL